MGSCNTTQNERSGKDLLLKICETIDVDVDTTTDSNNLVATAHGLEVNDMVRVSATELGTLDDLTADQLYFVKEVVDADTFTISASPGGTAIDFTNDYSAVEFELFKTIGGLRSASNAFASEAIETTNYGSNQWRTLKDGAGIKTVSISGDGVYTSAANFRAMEADAYASNLVCLAFVDVSAGRVYHGCFKIASLEASAEYNGEANYTASFESSGEITIYQAA